MEDFQSERSSLQRLTYEWDPNFAYRQTAATYAVHNKPFFVKSYEESESYTADDIIDAFMKDSSKTFGSSFYQAIEVKGFCRLADLGVLKAGIAPQVNELVALLDDRNDEGPRLDKNKAGTRRTDHDGALSAHQLYNLMRKKVSASPTRPGIQAVVPYPESLTSSAV
jgi:hypothetical protein